MRLEVECLEWRPVSWSDHGTYWYLGTLKGSRNGWQRELGSDHSIREMIQLNQACFESYSRFNRTGCVIKTFPEKFWADPSWPWSLATPPCFRKYVMSGSERKGQFLRRLPARDSVLDSFSGRGGADVWVSWKDYYRMGVWSNSRKQLQAWLELCPEWYPSTPNLRVY